jgi:hypothetical protein
MLIAEAKDSDIFARLARLEQRYRKACPECGLEFWIDEKLVKTSIMDGSLQGYRCPVAGCKGIVKMEATKK